jgi:hypothetical protein
MVVCTRNGCKNEYKEEDNVEGACTYHPGAPVGFVFLTSIGNRLIVANP